MDLFVKQDDGTYIKIPIKVEVRGTGVVSYPDKEGDKENG